MAIANTEPMVAVVRCNGTCEHRPRIAEYSGLRTCAAMHACGAGETALGMAIANTEPMVAVVRCNGTCEHRPRIAEYSGLRTCAAMHACGAGETACGFGCLGCGDCEAACQFDAIKVNPETGIPEVDEDKCTSCGACVKACPRNIIELRKKGPKGRRVYVSCVNKD